VEHQPVLLEAVIEGLNIQASGFYVDATFGRGGHSREILKHLNQEGHLLVLDKDEEAILAAKKINDSRLIVKHASIAELSRVIEEITAGTSRDKNKKLECVNGLLLDLGVSSPQLDDASRGFSFLKDAPLDMRMNQRQKMDAASWINQANEAEIAHVLWAYGEERFSRRIASAIVRERAEKPITRTTQLADIVLSAMPRKEKHHHPATRTFQAVRIFINQELEELKECLSQTLDVLAIGGRLCVITFHSLEDRMAKQFMKKQAETDDWPVKLPIKADQMKIPRLKIIGAKTPSQKEVTRNPRSRSARLRIGERLS